MSQQLSVIPSAAAHYLLYRKLEALNEKYSALESAQKGKCSIVQTRWKAHTDRMNWLQEFAQRREQDMASGVLLLRQVVASPKLWRFSNVLHPSLTEILCPYRCGIALFDFLVALVSLQSSGNANSMVSEATMQTFSSAIRLFSLKTHWEHIGCKYSNNNNKNRLYHSVSARNTTTLFWWFAAYGCLRFTGVRRCPACTWPVNTLARFEILWCINT